MIYPISTKKQMKYVFSLTEYFFQIFHDYDDVKICFTFTLVNGCPKTELRVIFVTITVLKVNRVGIKKIYY